MDNKQKSSIQIRVATHNWEKEMIFRFRYNIFIEEMSKQCFVDHKNKKMRDELDDQSILLYAVSDSNIVGTSRITINTLDKFPGWLSDSFCLQKYQTILGRNAEVAFSTKVAILPEFRGSTVMYQLITEHFKIFQDNNIIVSFSGSNPNLIPLYEKIGYRKFTKNFSEPGHGLLVPFVIILDDTDHLRTVHSPLYRLVKKNRSSSLITDYFKKEFPKANEYINTQLLSRENLLKQLRTVFNGTTQADLHLLSKLNEKEHLSLFKLGAIFSCTKGDCIVRYNEVGSGLYFLLSGSLLSQSTTNSILLKPGQYFGNFITTKNQIPTQISAVTPSDILIIPHQAFERFKHLHPKTAKVILNALEFQLLNIFHKQELDSQEESV